VGVKGGEYFPDLNYIIFTIVALASSEEETSDRELLRDCGENSVSSQEDGLSDCLEKLSKDKKGRGVEWTLVLLLVQGLGKGGFQKRQKKGEPTN